MTYVVSNMQCPNKTKTTLARNQEHQDKKGEIQNVPLIGEHKHVSCFCTMAEAPTSRAHKLRTDLFKKLEEYAKEHRNCKVTDVPSNLLGKLSYPQALS